MQTADDTREARARELVLDRYRLDARLGAGGFGVVWLAHDERLQREVAVKRVVLHDEAVAARAEREARAAARLQHPGIVALFECGRDDDAVYLVSELVRGRTLADLLAAGELSDRDVLRVGVALCDALAHAHSRGVVHRDVKPGNVIVPDRPQDGGGVAKLTDFGVAHMAGDDALTRTGDVVGTLAYMAPEQAEGGEVTAQADLYALALVVFEGLAGVNPVRGRGAAATARRVGARLPSLGRLRRDLPLELCHALDRAVRPRPEQRGTLDELRAALAAGLPAVSDERGTIAGSPVEGLARPLPRRPLRLRDRAVAGLAAGALAAAAVAWVGPQPLPWPPLAVAVAVAVAVGALPRAGWLAALAALCAAVDGDDAALLLAAAAPTVLLLPRAGTLWSLPAGGPLLGWAGAPVAWPALAGQAASPWHRAALGALGCWWLLLAEALSGDRLAAGGFELEAAGPEVAVAAVWAGAALVLPVLVRGRAVAADVVMASAWAAGLGAATQALAPDHRGVVAGAALAGALAVGARASRGEARVRCGS